MRYAAWLGIVLVVVACTGARAEPSVDPSPIGASSPAASPIASPPAEPTPAPTASAEPTAEPTPSPTAEATPSPEATPDTGLVAAAIAYAERAGFALADDPRPRVRDRAPDYASVLLHEVSLRLAGGDRLDVYLDDRGTVIVVEAARPDEPGAEASRDEILRAAHRAVRQAGADPAAGEFHVALHYPGSDWYLTFDREIGGHRVANAPMGWWLTGDKATVQLAPDGSLVSLYLVRPDHRPIPERLDPDTLRARLARAAEVSQATLASFELELLWVLAFPAGADAYDSTLRLGYCATHRFPSGWEAWCVDAGTGEPISREGGVD